MTEKLDFCSNFKVIKTKMLLEERLRKIGFNIKNKSYKTSINLLNGEGWLRNDFYLIDNMTYVFIVDDINRIKSFNESAFEDKFSFLFVDTDYNVRFYDAETLFQDSNKKAEKRDFIKGDNIRINRCSKCGKVTLVNDFLSWACNSCGFYNSENDFIGFFNYIFDDLAYKPMIDIERDLTKKEKYNDYLKSEEWASKREEVFALQGKECCVCGNTEGLNVHHLNYDNLYHEEQNNYRDLVVLCNKHHDMIHDFVDISFEDLEDLIKETSSDAKKKFFADYKKSCEEAVYKAIRCSLKEDEKNVKFLEPLIGTIWGKYSKFFILNPRINFKETANLFKYRG